MADLSEAAILVREAGIDPNTVSSFGLSASAYWEVQYDPEGNRIIDSTSGSVSRVRRPWPTGVDDVAIYRAVNG